MDRLLRLARSLGPAGAVANAQELLVRRRQEDFAVRRLVRSLEAHEAQAVAGPAEGPARRQAAAGRHAA